MRASVLGLCVPGLVALSAGTAFAQEDVVVNGQIVTAKQIQTVQARLGIPEAAQARIPPGRYWYDPVS
ncbi:MAG: hypothetical protein GWN99_03345, partial [Gemmatimonadetes bacterium]|nr:hypothetical protein [Gemmatimonadota bacterium]NIS00102.1 hypothetical protein [Gemmatimonadota bacterium]NIT65691.1 hypothetical protein [Gemmatimonadota bacterium]NIU51644.1 hypothetical protein [Gemmatimonadota bacterium]NIV22422.1 hypothetical protein [Gemmatimonadota bacterium]